MRNKLLLLLVTISFIKAAPLSFRVQVRDVWSGQIVKHAFGLVQNDTLQVDAKGFLHFESVEALATVRIGANGYFTEVLTANVLHSLPIVYLTPIEQTTFITVVRKRAFQSPLSIPTHRTLLTFSRPLTGSQLTQVLRMQSGLFLKSYGPTGSLQSIAVRGMSAEQTQVFVDGVPLNNLQLGSTDFSLLQGTALSAVEVYRGSSPILSGSGAIGGTLHFQTISPENHLKILVNSGHTSLKNNFFYTLLNIPTGKLKSVLQFSHANGRNHFTIQENGEQGELKNRDFRQNVLSLKSVYPLTSTLHWTLRLTQTRKQAGSPKPFTGFASEAANRARISIDNTLLQSTLKFSSSNLEGMLNGYLRNEWMAYRDPVLVINGQSLHSLHFNQEKGLQGRFHYSPRQALLIKSGVEYARQHISSSDAGQHGRSRASGYLLTDWQLLENRFSLQAFHLNAGLRLEKYSNHAPIFLPSVGLLFQWQQSQLFASAGKNFRIPGFNDLYWVPGGNPHLKAESAINVEVGGRSFWVKGPFYLQIESSLFQNRVKDQIKWLPNADGLWQPFNIAAVKSQGVELDFSLNSLNNLHQLFVTYTFTCSVKDKAEFPGDYTVGKQLPFLPREQIGLKVHSTWQPFRFFLATHYVSFRYLDFNNDPNRILPSYWESNFEITYSTAVKKLAVEFTFQIENLLNQSYRILPGYPMPGRYFAFSLQLMYNHQNKGGYE